VCRCGVPWGLRILETPQKCARGQRDRCRGFSLTLASASDDAKRPPWCPLTLARGLERPPLSSAVCGRCFSRRIDQRIPRPSIRLHGFCRPLPPVLDVPVEDARHVDLGRGDLVAQEAHVVDGGRERRLRVAPLLS